MTTIAYKYSDSEIAIDSRLTSSGTIVSDSALKYRYVNDDIWLFCGNNCDFDELSSLKHKDKVREKINASALVCCAGGVVYQVTINEDNYCEWYEISEDFSIGSGSDHAITAMDMGASAKVAVEMACKRDIYTGGEIIIFSTKG